MAQNIFGSRARHWPHDWRAFWSVEMPSLVVPGTNYLAVDVAWLGAEQVKVSDPHGTRPSTGWGNGYSSTSPRSSRCLSVASPRSLPTLRDQLTNDSTHVSNALVPTAPLPPPTHAHLTAHTHTHVCVPYATPKYAMSTRVCHLPTQTKLLT